MVCCLIFFLIIRRPPRATRTDTLFPYTTLCRSAAKNKTLPLCCQCLAIATAHDGQQPVGLRAQQRKQRLQPSLGAEPPVPLPLTGSQRSEEHTSELQSLMRISYAVFCLKKKKQHHNTTTTTPKTTTKQDTS